jgi:hypothetical protein
MEREMNRKVNTAQSWEETRYPDLLSQIGVQHFNNWKKENVKVVSLQSPLKTTKTAFLLYNILSEDECKKLISASETTGFEDAKDYCFVYRDRYNDRLMSDDLDLSKLIWNRTTDFLPQRLQDDFGKWWSLKGLNERWRYCKYVKGHYFGGHVDGCYQPSNTEKSFLTLMLYLNSQKKGDFKGGCTRFFDGPFEKNIKYKVVPEAGMCIVFMQQDGNFYHDGEKLEDGVKYILRCDVMYTLEGEESLA